MECRYCHQEIPDGKYQPLLGCRRWLEAQAYQAMLELQISYLPELRDGRRRLIITKPSDAIAWHMALLYYPRTAWCGQTLKRWKEKKLMAYPDITLKLCDRCEEVFGQMGVA